MECLKFYILLITTSLFQISTFGQVNANKIDSLVKKLSWNSITMNCEATILVLKHHDTIEKELVKIGKPATYKLIDALADSSKTVIAHIILTQIWGSNEEKYDFSTIYIYKECSQLIGWHHLYNGLIWDWSEKTGNTIKQSEIQKIKKYWTEKLIEKKNIILDIAQIFNDLEKQDKELYPCNKVYDNNSKSVKYKELFNLFGKKSNDSLCKRLWNKLGNDSIINNGFNNYFFITYGPDGLSFLFKTDSTLTKIFINEFYYKGELPYNLKFTDSKSIVRKKIGKPFKSGKYVDNTWGWYKDKYLYLNFDKKRKIIGFSISKD